MIIEKIFSELNTDEKLYSVLMDEEEIALFSAISPIAPLVLNQINNLINKKSSIGNVKEVSDLNRYFRENHIKGLRVKKFLHVNAVKANGGEEVTSKNASGLVEKTAVANPGDYITNNVGTPDNKWIIKGDKFNNLYKSGPIAGEYIPNGPTKKILKTKGGETIAFKNLRGERIMTNYAVIRDDLSAKASRKAGIPKKTSVYPMGLLELLSTYKPTGQRWNYDF